MADAPTPAGNPPHEPVLVTLSTPARRSLVAGLVRPVTPRPQAPVLHADGSDAEVADFLAAIAHAQTGYLARTDSGPRALAVVAATAAALCGEDIRAALAAPDLAFLTALKPPAIEAVRGVLLAVETEQPEAVRAALAVLEP